MSHRAIHAAIGVVIAVSSARAQDKPRGQITAKELLDLDTPAIERDFADDPDSAIELLGVAASIYRELDDQPRFETLHRRQFELARKTYGDLHPAANTSATTPTTPNNRRAANAISPETAASGSTPAACSPRPRCAATSYCPSPDSR